MKKDPCDVTAFSVDYAVDGLTLTLTASESCRRLSWCAIQRIILRAYLTYLYGEEPEDDCACCDSIPVTWDIANKAGIFTLVGD